MAAQQDVPTCQVCGQSVDEEEYPDHVVCALCSTPHHKDCWEYTGRCSTYGCGGIVAAKPGRRSLPATITIDEDTKPPVAVGAALRGFLRRVTNRATDLPATLKAGLVGSAATIFGYGILFGWTRNFWRMLPAMASGILACGVLHGILAPFVAPVQHRYPRTTTIATMVAALGFWYASGIGVDAYWTQALAFYIPTVVLGIVSVTTAAEWLFGPYSPWGRRLGTWATSLRYLTTGILFFLLSLFACYTVGVLEAHGIIEELALWALLAAFSGGPSLEQGRAEYRKRLIALAEEGGGTPK